MNGGGLSAASCIAGSQDRGYPTEARESHVGKEMNRASRLVEGIAKLTVQIGDRLNPVLRNEPSQAGIQNEKQPRPTLVGHANALSSQNDQLQLIQDALAGILDRLEL